MRILVFGGWGQLGTDLAVASEGRHELLRPTRGEADVTDPSAPAALTERFRPHVVAYLAAFHQVERCERDPLQTFAVNAVAARSVAIAAKAVGARCVYVSTDYVFDGAQTSGYGEDDRTNPLSVYGISKVAGERGVQVACPDSLIVRASALFGHAGSSGKGGNFVETMVAKAAAGEPIAVVDDLTFAPTCSRDLAERILDLADRRVEPGIYHGANGGSCTWYAFAREIFEQTGMAADLVPRATGEGGVPRPRSSILLDTKGPAAGLAPARTWQDALGWYLAERPEAAARRSEAAVTS